MENPYLLAILFFLVSIFYSSVGFGGGSSYLAILILAGVELYLLRSTALMCNIIVAGGGTYIFIRKGYLDIRKSIPFVAFSIPMAFIGGYLPLKAPIIFIILGLSLLTAAILLWKSKLTRRSEKPSIKDSITSSGSIGGSIGFLSGMVGIGGGIFLSPVLNLLNWSISKKIAAIASFFILVNSVAGLFGQWLQNPPNVDLALVWPLLLAVFIGGQIGSRMAVAQFSNTTIRKATAILMVMASLKILNDHLFHL